MFIKNRALLLFTSTFAFLIILTTIGCGGGVQTSRPNPSGFTNASLNGTYVFSISGNNGGFFAITGSFTANGSGAITGGTEDINDPTGGGTATNVSLNGSYAVRSDGRTTATITSTSLNPAFKFVLDFVLLSTQKGLAIQFDQNGTASGTIDLQNSSAANLTTLAGSFAFNVAGVNSNNPNTQGSESSAGLVTFDSSGNITSGLLDDNNAGTVNGGAGGGTPASITTASAAISSPVNGRGTATITTSGSLVGTRNFVYYVIDSNHLKLIETDSFPILAGDAFRQSSTAVAGSFAFTLAGATATGHQIFVGGGILNTDGAGNILNSSVEDLDNGGTLTAAGGAGVSGTYSVSGGRGTMQLVGPITLNLVFYPSTGGLQLLDVDAGAIEASGAALQQSGAPFSNSSINNGFGLNFSGVVAPGTVNESEVDAIAQFNSTGSGSLSGALDVNNFGALNSSLALGGSYSVGSNGRGTAALRSSQGNINLIFYIASNSQILFVELDEGIGQISVGTFAAQ
jgi:hypothetical protein